MVYISLLTAKINGSTKVLNEIDAVSWNRLMSATVLHFKGSKKFILLPACFVNIGMVTSKSIHSLKTVLECWEKTEWIRILHSAALPS